MDTVGIMVCGRACAATGISEVGVLMQVRVPGPVEVPWVGRGRYRMAHGRACFATNISAVGRGGPKTLFRDGSRGGSRNIRKVGLAL